MMNSVSQLKVGIAGYGVVGKRRAEFIRLHPNLSLVAVCDLRFSSNEDLPVGLRVFSSYDLLLEENLDILFVCLPNYLAAEVTIAGLSRGIHVFCEKPPGRDLDDMARVIKVENQNSGTLLKYGFNHRYHHSVREALRLVDSGELGEVINLRGVYGKSKIISFESSWRTQRTQAGGGILLDQGIHMVDMMRLFAGEFVEVKSFISNQFWKHEVEDNAYALMKTSTGVVAMLHSSATQWRHRFQLEITLSQGQIILDGILSGSKSYGAETLTVVYSEDDESGNPREETKSFDEDPSWKDEVFDFADSILLQKVVEGGTSSDAFKTMQLVYQIYCSDKDWRVRYGLSEAVSTKELGS